MTSAQPSIRVNVDVTNPGQFFACCGLLELADRLWPGAEGWFERDVFCISTQKPGASLTSVIDALAEATVANTMSADQLDRLQQLSAMSVSQRRGVPGADDEKKALESLRRELPITLSGCINFRIDWFLDTHAGGSRFKTWAGQQSVLDIATSMHAACTHFVPDDDSLWFSATAIGLPFNFDSDLGIQGSGRDIGLVFDALAGNEITRIAVSCRPLLELLCFVGLQRFRPREVTGHNRFIYCVWTLPLDVHVAPAAAAATIGGTWSRPYEFSLLYRTKYLKSFLPAIPSQGDLL